MCNLNVIHISVNEQSLCFPRKQRGGRRLGDAIMVALRMLCHGSRPFILYSVHTFVLSYPIITSQLRVRDESMKVHFYIIYVCLTRTSQPEPTSRDHSATSTILHSRQLFQGPGLLCWNTGYINKPNILFIPTSIPFHS
jgi:hypothetical protein